MPLTLWRGPQLCGALHVREPSGRESPAKPGQPPQLSALLLPVDGLQGLSGVMQTIATIVPGRPVFQHALRPDVVSERATRAKESASQSGSEPLLPLTPEQARGVPVEQQFTLRSSAGETVLPRLISVQEIRLDDVASGSGREEELPPGAQHHGSIWSVFVVFESDVAATSARGFRPR